MRRRDAGYAHTRSVLDENPLAGVVLHEHMDVLPIAAE